MTLHQLTHSAGFDSDLGIVAAIRRAVDAIAAHGRRWVEARREAEELSRLDYRERADLNFRR